MMMMMMMGKRCVRAEAEKEPPHSSASSASNTPQVSSPLARELRLKLLFSFWFTNWVHGERRSRTHCGSERVR